MTGGEGAVIYTLGCRSGLNVPDVDSGTGPLTLDFAQAFATRGATYIANTGNGYGDSSEVAFSELLLSYFNQRIGQVGGITLGQAHIKAKQQYIQYAGIAGFGLFDEKVLGVSTLYGLPMYRVELPNLSVAAASLDAPAIVIGAAASTQGDSSNQSAVSAASVQAANNNLTSQTVNLTPIHTLVTTPEGNYYKIGDERQVRPGRPVLPRTGVDIVSATDTHGVVLLSADYVDEPFTPLITGLITDNVGISIPYTSTGWFPAQMGVINRLPLARETFERLVVIPAQYKSGTLRKYTDLTYEIYTSDSEDRIPPQIRNVDASIVAGTTVFTASVSSDTGIERVLTSYTDGNGTWSSLDLLYDSDLDLWQGTLTGTATISYFVQAVDADGDVALIANKGQLFSLTGGALPETAMLISPLGSISDTSLTFTWSNVEHASGYTLVVYDADNEEIEFSQDFATDICTGNTCSIEVSNLNLAPGSYTWLVRAFNAAGNGPWSIYSP